MRRAASFRPRCRLVAVLPAHSAQHRSSPGLSYLIEPLERRAGVVQQHRCRNDPPRCGRSLDRPCIVTSDSRDRSNWLRMQSGANQSRRSISLITGKIQGNSRRLIQNFDCEALNRKASQSLAADFPTQMNREFSCRNRETNPWNRKFAQAISEVVHGARRQRRSPKVAP
jgi:hypothetical protein